MEPAISHECACGHQAEKPTQILSDEHRVIDRVLGALEGFCRDQDPRADAHGVVNGDDVGRAHADAPVAGGGADVALLRRAVNVNVAVVGVLVLRFETFEPQDAGDDRVASGGIHLEDFSGRAP